MSKKHLHFYGKYAGEIKVIYDVLKEIDDYVITHDLTGLVGKERYEKADYCIISHNAPKYNNAPRIHTLHGLTHFNFLVGKLSGYKKMWNALCAYNDDVKQLWKEKCGFSDEQIMVVGMPSSIEFLAPVNKEDRQKWFTDRELDSDKKTVLYSPTWDHGDGRGLFVEWWQDGKEEDRVRRWCSFVVESLGANLIVRLHERHRYKTDWISKYKDTLKEYGVHAVYLGDDVNNLPYLRYSDMLVGDLSSMNTYFYVMDKPVVHIGENPFPKRQAMGGYGGIPFQDRPGLIVSDFENLLEGIKQSLLSPNEFSEARRKFVDDYVSYTGEACKQAVIQEFSRVCNG